MKNHFNDYRPNGQNWATACASCRCEITMMVVHYPHGPNEVCFCPVCGVNIRDEKNGTIKQPRDFAIVGDEPESKLIPNRQLPNT